MKHRIVAAVLTLALLGLAIPPAPVDATENLTAIDPLQTATRLESLSIRTLIAASIASKSITGEPLGDDKIVKPPLAAIPFVPFPIVDPAASAVPVASGTLAGTLVRPPILPSTIITAPSGKQVKASDYWSFINSVEQDLNKRGQTLRKGKTFDLGRYKGSTQAELVASLNRHPEAPGAITPLSGKTVPLAAVRSLVPLPMESDMLADDAAPSPSPSPTAPPSVSSAKATAKPTPKPTPVPTPKGTPEPPPSSLPYGYKSEDRKPIDPLPDDNTKLDYADTHYSKSYTESEGSRGSHAAEFYLSATMTADGKHDGGQTLLGKVDTGVYVLGAGGDIASATANVTPTKGSIDIEAVGSTLYENSSSLPYDDSFDQSGTLLNITVPLQIGPFFIQFGADVTGEIGVDLEITGGSEFAALGVLPTASVTPHFTVAGVFSASLGIGIADVASVSVGVSGNILIASVRLPLLASAGFTLHDSRSGTAGVAKNIYACHAHFSYSLKSELVYTFLSGTLTGNVTGCFIFCDTLLNFTVATWSGIGGKDTLFKLSGDAPVGDIYTDLPQYGYTLHGSSYKIRFSKDDDSGIPAACHNYYKSLGEQIPTT